MSPTSLAKGKAQVKDCQLALNLEEEVVHIVFREMISGTIIILAKLATITVLSYIRHVFLHVLVWQLPDGLIKRKGGGYLVVKKTKRQATPSCTSAVADSEIIDSSPFEAGDTLSR